MKRIRYVLLDPTGNLTCLVTDPLPPPERPGVTEKLMDRCEQVGYLIKTREGPRLEMMGGEFCGNASMACAAYLAHTAGAAAQTPLLLSVSGAEEKVECLVRPLAPGLWEGRVAMPPVTECRPTALNGRGAALVRMQGIAHLILEGPPPEKAEAEALLKGAAPALREEAVGLLLWDGRFMRPLVLVKNSGTLVWETGCGSGSTALGAYLALAHGEGVTRSEISQPGGILTAEAEVRGGRVTKAFLTGKVRIVKEDELLLP